MMGIERRLNTAVGSEKKKSAAGRPRKSSLVEIDKVVSGGKDGYETGSAPDILCKVALDLFASQNFSTVTIKDIADATGLNASLIYYYFGNKEGLFMRAIERTVEEAFAHYDEISRNADSPDKLISLWMELHVRQFVSLQKVAKISLDYANTQNHSPATDRAIKALYVHSHMDEETFDTERAVDCCNSNCYADGTTIPVCNYNVLFREKEARFNAAPATWGARSGGQRAFSLPVLR